MHTPTSRPLMGRTALEWFSTLPVFIMLILTLVIGTGEMVHGQLLKLGESLFGNPETQVQYFMLRAEPVKPECNPSIDIDAEVQRQSAAPAQGGDDIDNLFGDTATANDPAVLRKSIEQAQAICQAKHSLYERVLALQTPQVQMYRTIETSFFGLFQIGTENRHRPLNARLRRRSIAAVSIGHEAEEGGDTGGDVRTLPDFGRVFA